LHTAAAIHADGLGSVLDSIPTSQPLYVTIDADGLDPSVMPAVMGPAPGGLRFEQVSELLTTLARRQRVVGMDLVELAPRFDASNALSSITAGRLLLTVMGHSGLRARVA
jgi:agmatinase